MKMFKLSAILLAGTMRMGLHACDDVKPTEADAKKAVAQAVAQDVKKLNVKICYSANAYSDWGSDATAVVEVPANGDITLEEIQVKVANAEFQHCCLFRASCFLPRAVEALKTKSFDRYYVSGEKGKASDKLNQFKDQSGIYIANCDEIAH